MNKAQDENLQVTPLFVIFNEILRILIFIPVPILSFISLQYLLT